MQGENNNGQPRVYTVFDETKETREAREDERDYRTSILVRSVVAEAVREAVDQHMPTPEERQWIKLAMKREARREALQNAIIEKSLLALVIGFFGWIVLAGIEYLRNHTFKA